MKTRKITMMAVSICLCLTLPSFAAERIAVRSFSIPQHGKLMLNIPSTWKQGAGDPVKIFPTITLSPDKGDAFKVLITPIWNTKNDPNFNKSEKVKSLIYNDLREMLPSAIEKDVNIREFKGVYGNGYYFLLTDKAPKPGEYTYATRSWVGVGDFLLSVTILSRSKNSEGITSTIMALKGAKHIK